MAKTTHVILRAQHLPIHLFRSLFEKILHPMVSEVPFHNNTDPRLTELANVIFIFGYNHLLFCLGFEPQYIKLVTQCLKLPNIILFIYIGVYS